MRPAILLLVAAAACHAADCSRATTGFPSFDDTYPQSYRGSPAGLYPDGMPYRPAAHEALGLKQAADVLPRGPDGSPDERSGRVVLLSIGMSNTTAEFSAFRSLAARDTLRDLRLTLVDGAFGGASANAILANPDQYWVGADGRSGVMGRLSAAGVTSAQVQAAWVKLADSSPNQPFPENARKLQSEIETIILTMMVPRFPNLKLVYLSNRIYAGYASTALNPEPHAYESAFAVKWLIEGQLNGDPRWDAAGGRAPWLGWGPNLWADGTTRRFDGLSWECSDLAADGTHPSASGQQKVASLLLDFFRTDSTARGWYLARGAAPAAPAVEAVVNAAGYRDTIAAGSIVSIFGTGLAAGPEQAVSLPLPRVLGGTRVEVDGHPALLYFVSPGQINFVMPWTGGASLRVVRAATASAAAEVHPASAAPGLFTLDSRPDGPAAVTHADGSVVSAASPARPGKTLQMFGSGMGVTDPRLKAPLPAPEVRVGGQPAQVLYAGRAPGWPGMDQINFAVPETVPAGNSVPLEFVYRNRSNTVALAVGGASAVGRTNR